MKQTRLLEIIREEIAGALNEMGQSPEEAKATALSIAAKKAQIVAAQKELAQLSKTGVTESEELEEDNLNEMAYDITIKNPEKLAKLKDEIKDSSKEGKKLLYKVIDIIQRDKKENKPIRQRDIANELETIQQKINPLVNLLIDYEILEKGESVTGVTKKKVTDKAQGRPTKEKSSEEPKIEKTPKAKVATRTPEKDGMDDVSSLDVDSEDKEATQNIGKDKTAKDLGNISSRKDKIVKFYQELKPQVDDKISQAKEGDEKAKEWLKNTWTPILKAYNKAKEVKI